MTLEQEILAILNQIPAVLEKAFITAFVERHPGHGNQKTHGNRYGSSGAAKKSLRRLKEDKGAREQYKARARQKSGLPARPTREVGQRKTGRQKNEALAEKLLDTKSIDELVGIASTQSKTARHQLDIIDAFEKVASRRGRYQGGTPTLGDTIIHQQAQKVARYGEKAYKLSDKQLNVVFRDLREWRKR